MLCASFSYLYAPVTVLPNLLLIVLCSPRSFWDILSFLLQRVCLHLDAYKSFQLYMLCISCRLCRGKLIGLYFDGSRQSWLFVSRYVIPWTRKSGMFPASSMDWLKWCVKYEWVAVNRLIQKLFIPSGPSALQLSVLAISPDICPVVIGLCSIAVALDTLVCSLLIQLAFRLWLTAFPQVDAQKAVKACLSSSVSWQSGRPVFRLR